MSHPDYSFYLECGCSDVSNSLGFKKMPEGYALMLNADETHFFWFEKTTGREGAECWDKWAVYKWAIQDAKAKEADHDE